MKNPTRIPAASNSRLTSALGIGAMSETNRQAVGDLSMSKRTGESAFSRERSTEYPYFTAGVTTSVTYRLP